MKIFQAKLLSLSSLSLSLILPLAAPVNSEPIVTENQLDLSPEIINESPVLQRWLKTVPNVSEEIQNDPSFRTRIGIGYAEFPSSHHRGGINVRVEDIFIGQTNLTLSGDYETSFNDDEDREAGGVNLNYYILPLGSYINATPIVGYRSIRTNNYDEDGVNVGAKIIFPLSRTGASDFSVSQTFMSPGDDNEVGITNLSFGYAITKNIRLATEIEKQNSRVKKDSQFSILVEWMP
ncbi:hypothetical protein VB715_14410 [Crocosphaera sp. UHCC 0190]|nr:hypothetical protein [Crocosphaera sp. UHCC 0190]MEA5510963.1 hypothetical protein [Crocosphaera sp. UHCC 0190]